MPTRRTGRAPETWTATWDAMMAVSVMQSLRIGCSFIPETIPGSWFTIAEDPRRHRLVHFELAHGLERERAEYNAACLAEVRKTKRVHLGTRGGFADLFVPVVRKGRLKGVLACGPLLTRRPTGELLREAWRGLGGGSSDARDEGFLRFVRGVLESHAFEGDVLQSLRRYLEEVADMMAGNTALRYGGSAVSRHLKDLRRRLPEIALWDAARELVDRDLHVAWTAGYRRNDRATLGIAPIPTHVVAVAPVDPSGETADAAEILIRADRLQRACAALTTELPGAVAGRLGDGAAFLLTHVRVEGERSRLRAFAERIIRRLRQRLGIGVVCGISERALHGGELPDRYDQASWAVLWGLHQSREMTFFREAASSQEIASPAGLYRSSRALCDSFASGRWREADVCAEHVVKDVLWLSSGGIEAMRSHFVEVVWDLLAITEQRALVDKQTSSDLLAGSTTRLRHARTPREVTTEFTLIVRELFEAIRRPAALDRRAKLQRARRLIEKGAPGQPLDLETVAKQVGWSAPHLSFRFKQAYGIGFAEFVLRVRLDHAKDLLRNTALSVREVSESSGFSSPSYFHQAFRRTTGTTPERYRTQRAHFVSAAPAPAAPAPTAETPAAT